MYAKPTLKTRGYTLLEVMISLGVIAVMSAGIFAARAYNAHQQAFSATEGVRHISMTMAGQFGTNEGYSKVTTNDLTQILPAQGFTAKDGAVKFDAWNSYVTAVPVNDGWNLALTFSAVPQNSCASFATDLQGIGSEVQVNNTPVSSPASIALQCSDSSAPSVTLVSLNAQASDTGEVTTPADNGAQPPAPVLNPPALDSHWHPGPIIPVGSPGTTPSSTGTLAPPIVSVTGAPVGVGNGVSKPIIPPSGPPPGTSFQVLCQAGTSDGPVSSVLETKTQTLGCPAGQVGSINQSCTRTDSSWVETIESCPSGVYYPPVYTTSNQTSQGPWGTWNTTSNTCANTCATQLASAAWKPNPDVETRIVGNQSAPCPAGYSGSDIWSQQQSESRTATCANPSSTAAPVWGPYSAWVNTGGKIGEVNTCAPSCPAGAAYYGTQGTAVPVSLSVLKGGGGETAAVSNIDYVATSVTGVLTGAYTAKISYMGQTGTATATCTTQGQTAKDSCDGSSATVTVGGGTFFVTVTAFAPIKGEDGSGPWGAKGWTYQASSAPGCGGTASPANPIRIQF